MFTIPVSSDPLYETSKKILESPLSSTSTKPERLVKEDLIQNSEFGTTSEIIDEITTSLGNLKVVWKSNSVLNGKVIGAHHNDVVTQKHYKVSICENSLFLDNKRIGYITAESDGQAHHFGTDYSYKGFVVHQVRLEPKYKKQGLGISMYIYLARKLAKEFDSPLQSGNLPKKPALRVWSRLSRLGFPVTQRVEKGRMGSDYTLRTLDLRD